MERFGKAIQLTGGLVSRGPHESPLCISPNASAAPVVSTSAFDQNVLVAAAGEAGKYWWGELEVPKVVGVSLLASLTLGATAPPALVPIVSFPVQNLVATPLGNTRAPSTTIYTSTSCCNNKKNNKRNAMAWMLPLLWLECLVGEILKWNESRAFLRLRLVQVVQLVLLSVTHEIEAAYHGVRALFGTTTEF